MDLAGSSYLYLLASISVTFAGFSALIAVIRQTVGGGLDKYDVFFVHAVLVRSLIVIISALLPPLLALFDLPPATIWRVSTAVAAVLIMLFSFTWPAIRRSVTKTPMRKVSVAYYALQVLTAIFLFVAAVGIFFEPSVAHFGVGLTVFMIVNWISVLLSLDILFRRQPSKERRK